MIELSGVWFRYPRSIKWALREVSVRFRPGEIVAITGPNGSGKTTLLKIASLIYKPTKGEILAWQSRFWGLRKNDKLNIRRRVVYVHEKPIILRRTVLQNIAYGLLVRGIRYEEAMERASAMLKQLGLSHLACRNAKELSAGEAHLVAIARALVLEPKIAFLDEPFSYLDRNNKQRLVNMIKELRDRGVGFVIATHDMSVVERLAERLLVLESGTIVEEHNLYRV